MKKLIMICALVLGSQAAKAGFVAEPYLGYQMGTVDKTTVPAFGSSTSTSKDKGTVIGARLGYSFLIPVVSFDYSMYNGKDDQSPSSKMTGTNMALTVGAQMIPLVRPYAGYIFSAKNKSDDGTSAATVTGTGMKVGLGIKILPLLNINVEYAKYDYKDIDGISGYTKVSEVYSDLKYTTTTIGLSYVF